MLDYRIETFLTLCETMNYRETAERLHITQPAVTQHIQYLEREYGCRLFTYEKRKLEKTPEASKLEGYAVSMKFNEEAVRKELNSPQAKSLRIGVTKTIGDFVIGDRVRAFLRDESHTMNLIVDNTASLLGMLEENKIDFAIVEGYFDKGKYDYQLYKKEPFVGICAENHPFAGQSVKLEDIFKETFICREKGSGTRGILEQKLLEFNENIGNFKRTVFVSTFKIITDLVKENIGISFVYNVIASKTQGIAPFYIEGAPIVREFNFVYLKNTNAAEKVLYFLRSNDSVN